jgi:hypothetical protein
LVADQFAPDDHERSVGGIRLSLDGTTGEFSILSRELLERSEKADAEKAKEAGKAL